jgi:hypothetical protein
MKNKFTLYILFTFLFNTAYSEVDSNDLTKKMQLALDKNQPDIAERIFSDNETSLNQSWQALERLAISFERQEKFKEASDVYKKLILNFNKTNHVKFINAKDKSSFPEIENTRLPFYYYKSAYLNAMLYKSNNLKIEDDQKKKYFNNTNSYLQLSKKLNATDDEVKLVEDILNDKQKNELDLVVVKKMYMSLEMVSWQDKVYLKSKTTGALTSLTSNVLGTGVSLGKKWESGKSETSLEGSFLYGKSTVSAINSDTYSQSSVNTMAFIIAPGFFYKFPINKKAMLGLDIPIMYRHGDYTLPEGSEFEKASILTVGYFIKSKVYFDKFGFQMKVGRTFANPGSQWSIGVVYDF